MTLTKDQVEALCAKHGPAILAPAGLDGRKIMFAIAGCESTWGKNCGPRHEPAYDRGGAYAASGIMPALLGKYGSAAACSYGPWQVMLANAPMYSPDELQTDPDKAALAFVHHLNGFVLHFRGAHTLQQIAETYNSGDFSEQPAPGVLRYATDCQQYYTSAP